MPSMAPHALASGSIDPRKHCKSRHSSDRDASQKWQCRSGPASDPTGTDDDAKLGRTEQHCDRVTVTRPVTGTDVGGAWAAIRHLQRCNRCRRRRDARLARMRPF